MKELSNIEDVLSVASVNTAYFSKLLMPETFTADFNTLHKSMFGLIDSPYPHVVIAAPRGIGKTSIVRARIIRDILFRKVHFVVYISKSATLAEMQTENIKAELTSNATIRKLFGDVRVNYQQYGSDESFSKKSWVAFGDVFVLPRGAGQQVRGLNWRNHRPDLIIVDDLEDVKELRNEQLRYDLKRWFFGDVMKSIDAYKKNYKVIYIDTLKHQDALLKTLLDSDDWHGISLAVCDDELHSYVPEFMSDEDIKREYENAVETGVVETFYMEYMNKATGGEHADFKVEYFKYYEEDDDWFIKLLKDGDIETIILVDPARSTASSAAETAVIAVGIDLKGNRIFVRDVISGKMKPDEMYDKVFSMADLYGVRVIGIEDAGLNEFITFPFENEMLRRRRFYELIKLKPRRGVEERGKIERIRSLVPFYRRGLVYHNKRVTTKLEQQLLSFPKSKLWDVMDCLAYITEMMSIGGRFFYPTDGDYNDPEIVEKEYEELIEEDVEPIGDEWQII